MKYLKFFGIISFTITIILSCERPSEETKILNQIFPELTKIMRIPIIEPITYPPPLPKTIFPNYFNRDRLSDTCINRQDLLNYRTSLDNYNKYLQDYYFDNYAFRQDSINTVIVIIDSLGYCMACSYEDKMPREYSNVMKNVNKSSGKPIALNLNQITNTGNFKLKPTSKLDWFPKIDHNDFWSKKRDYYLSGILRISRIHLDKSKTHGLFSCTKFGRHYEVYTLLIGIKKKNKKWYIDQTILPEY